jgi:hypothetical protein
MPAAFLWNPGLSLSGHAASHARELEIQVMWFTKVRFLVLHDSIMQAVIYL